MTIRSTMTSTALMIAAALTICCGGVEPDPGLPPGGDGPEGNVERLSFPDGDTTGVRSGVTRAGVRADSSAVDPMPGVEWQRYQALQVCNHGALQVKARDAAPMLRQGDFTIEFWVQVDQTLDRPLLAAGNLSIELRGGTIAARVGQQHLNSFPIWDREWFHVALERSGQLLTLYVNSIAVQGTAWEAGWENPTEDFILGGAPEPMHPGCALLDNVRVLSTAAYDQQPFTPAQKFKSSEEMVFGFSFDHVQPADGSIVDESKNSVEALLSSDATLVETSI
jgi:hypothetical protein